MTESTTPPDVNFYILPDSDIQRRLYFIYRLVEKAHAQQLNTVILTADDEQQKQIDKLIWTAKPAQFIAHECLSDNTTRPLPSILLTDNMARLAGLDFNIDVVIDLSYDATRLDYPKIMLVANQHPDILPNARMKYQAYANQGIKPNVYKIGS